MKDRKVTRRKYCQPTLNPGFLLIRQMLRSRPDYDMYIIDIENLTKETRIQCLIKQTSCTDYSKYVFWFKKNIET